MIERDDLVAALHTRAVCYLAPTPLGDEQPLSDDALILGGEADVTSPPVAAVTLGYNPNSLTQLVDANMTSLALSQPGFASYLAPHSPHNTLVLNEASFASTTPSPSPSTHPSLWETNTARH